MRKPRICIKRNVHSGSFSFFILTIGVLFRFKIIAASHLVLYLIAAFLFVIYMLTKKNLSTNYTNVSYLCAFISIGAMFFVFSENPSENTLLYHVLFFSMPVFYFMVTVDYILYIGKDSFLGIIKDVLPLYVLYLSVEAIMRFLLVFQQGSLIESFYIFKVSSFGYSDTNFLALTLLYISCMLRYLYHISGEKKYKQYQHLLVLFQILTLSRSVIITQCLILYLEFCYKRIAKHKDYMFLMMNTIFFLFGIFFLLSFVANDSSGRSKFAIIEGLKKITQFSLGNRLFGFGYGKGEFIYSYQKGDYGHLHIALLLGEIGIVGTVMYFLWLLRFVRISHRKAFYIIFGFMLTGFSLAFFDSSFYYCIGVIYALEKLKDKKHIPVEVKSPCI